MNVVEWWFIVLKNMNKFNCRFYLYFIKFVPVRNCHRAYLITKPVVFNLMNHVSIIIFDIFLNIQQLFENYSTDKC
jgi:hypothetical protein